VFTTTPGMAAQCNHGVTAIDATKIRRTKDLSAKSCGIRTWLLKLHFSTDFGRESRPDCAVEKSLMLTPLLMGSEPLFFDVQNLDALNDAPLH
jgi:hypothetical protein